jgi:hypothetical protein
LYGEIIKRRFDRPLEIFKPGVRCQEPGARSQEANFQPEKLSDSVAPDSQTPKLLNSEF